MEVVINATWIFFVKTGDTGKTYIYEVFSKEGGMILGEVKWFSNWRKYAFFPKANCLFEEKCLQDIIDFLKKLMLERKIQKQQG